MWRVKAGCTPACSSRNTGEHLRWMNRPPFRELGRKDTCTSLKGFNCQKEQLGAIKCLGIGLVPRLKCPDWRNSSQRPLHRLNDKEYYNRPVKTDISKRRNLESVVRRIISLHSVLVSTNASFSRREKLWKRRGALRGPSWPTTVEHAPYPRERWLTAGSVSHVHHRASKNATVI